MNGLIDGRYPNQPSTFARRHLAGIPYGDYARTSDPWVRQFFGPTPGLSAWWNPLDWFESPSKDVLAAAMKKVQEGASKINGQDVRLSSYYAQVHPYSGVSESRIRAAAQAMEARITGLSSAFNVLKAQGAALASQISTLPPDTTRDDAVLVYRQAESFQAQAVDFVDQLKALKNDVASFVDPGVLSKLENGLTSIGAGIGGTIERSTMIVAGVVGIGLLALIVSPNLRKVVL